MIGDRHFMRPQKYLPLFVIVVSMITLHSVQASIATDSQLMLPSITVLSYCHSKVFDPYSKYFNLHRPDKRRLKPISLGWKHCRIASVKLTNLVGKKIEVNRVVKSGDIEVVLEVEATAENQNLVKQKYWFLLRRFRIGWQIISYALMGE